MKILNGKVLIGSTNTFKRTDLQIDNENISRFGQFDYEPGDYDASGMYVIPGFIDTHIHGFAGVEFAAESGEFDKALKMLASQGITCISPTVRSMALEQIIAAEKNIVKQSKKPVIGSKIKGIHTEGPFVSEKYRGAMTPPDIEATVDAFIQICEAGQGLLKIMTMAPERENSQEIIKEAVKRNVKISMGHTGASYEQAKAAVDSGASRVTHIFNAMVPFSHRSTGILGEALTDSRVNCEMICDFIHLSPQTVKLVYLSKGKNGITVISDTGSMSGLGDGVYMYWGKKRVVKDGICRNEEGKIAGSCFSVLYGLKNLLKLGIPLEDISVMGSYNPACALGIENETGSIECGKKADLIICDKELNIKAVFVNGIRAA